MISLAEFICKLRILIRHNNSTITPLNDEVYVRKILYSFSFKFIRFLGKRNLDITFLLINSIQNKLYLLISTLELARLLLKTLSYFVRTSNVNNHFFFKILTTDSYNGIGGATATVKEVFIFKLYY